MPRSHAVGLAKQPTDDLAGVARQARPRRQPLELALHQRLAAAGRTSARSPSVAASRAVVCGFTGSSSISQSTTSAVAAAVGRDGSRPGSPTQSRRSTSGSGWGSASRSRDGGSAPRPSPTAVSGGVSAACTANHLSTTSRSCAQSAWKRASASAPCAVGDEERRARPSARSCCRPRRTARAPPAPRDRARSGARAPAPRSARRPAAAASGL